VRRHCVDVVLKWPGEVGHQTSYAAQKVHGSVTELLELTGKNDPFPTWENYLELIAGYGHDLFSIRDAVVPAVLIDAKGNESARDKLKPKELKALEFIENEGPKLGKLIAKHVGVSEKTLRKYILPALAPFDLKNDRDGSGYYIARCRAI
jgi:hypothetical protein